MKQCSLSTKSTKKAKKTDRTGRDAAGNPTIERHQVLVKVGGVYGLDDGTKLLVTLQGVTGPTATIRLVNLTNSILLGEHPGRLLADGQIELLDDKGKSPPQLRKIAGSLAAFYRK